MVTVEVPRWHGLPEISHACWYIRHRQECEHVDHRTELLDGCNVAIYLCQAKLLNLAAYALTQVEKAAMDVDVLPGCCPVFMVAS